MRTKSLLISSLIMLAVVSAAGAQTAAPLPDPKPTFSPGMYETEARNSALPNAPVKSRLCIASADYDAFRDEEIGQYRKSDLVKQGCKLGDAPVRAILPVGSSSKIDASAGFA